MTKITYEHQEADQKTERPVFTKHKIDVNGPAKHVEKTVENLKKNDRVRNVVIL